MNSSAVPLSSWSCPLVLRMSNESLIIASCRSWGRRQVYVNDTLVSTGPAPGHAQPPAPEHRVNLFRVPASWAGRTRELSHWGSPCWPPGPMGLSVLARRVGFYPFPSRTQEVSTFLKPFGRRHLFPVPLCRGWGRVLFAYSWCLLHSALPVNGNGW